MYSKIIKRKSSHAIIPKIMVILKLRIIRIMKPQIVSWRSLVFHNETKLHPVLSQTKLFLKEKTLINNSLQALACILK